MTDEKRYTFAAFQEERYDRYGDCVHSSEFRTNSGLTSDELVAQLGALEDFRLWDDPNSARWRVVIVEEAAGEAIDLLFRQARVAAEEVKVQRAMREREELDRQRAASRAQTEARERAEYLRLAAKFRDGSGTPDAT